MPSPDFLTLADSEIIDACLAGDGRAWEALILRYQRLIYSIPLRYGLPESDAADIFQAVCMLLLENLARLRDRTRLVAWLVITTRRECWRQARQRRRVADGPDFALIENLPADDSPLEDTFSRLEQLTAVRVAVQRLDSRCRQLITLLFYTRPQPSYEEIASILGLPLGSIGPTRARCLEKLLGILKSMGFE